MRDAHRLKEKYELSLDNRQVVTVTVASLVVIAGVFLLGVVVGKKLSAEAVMAAQQAPQSDLLGQLDQKTQALESVKGEPTPLTFQDELLRKTPAVTPVPVAQPVARAPELKVEVPPAEAKEVPKMAEAPGPPPTEVSNPTLPAEPKVEAVPTRTVDAGGLKEAFGKAQRAPAEATPNGSWTLQLSAYQTKSEAERFVGGLRDKGFAPYIVEAAIPGKGTWYRVRMGRFSTKEAAGRYLQDFRRETALNALVTQ